jgi:hypothetical protein
MYKEGEVTTSTGFDYASSSFVNRLVSKRLLMNPTISGFLSKIEPFFIEILDSVKKLQFYQNYTIDKNDRSINQ